MTQCQSVSFSDIDLSDDSYRITRAGEDLSALALAIAAQGMLNPPCLIEQSKPDLSGFVVVSGFRRLSAARSLGNSQVRCRVYPSAEAAACARIAVAENAFSRELGPGELARAVRLMSRHMDSGTLAKQSLEIFNTRLNRNFVDTLIALSRLNEKVFLLMDSGQLAIKAVRALSAIPKTDAELLLDLFSAIKASSGKQMEILTWAREICAKEGIQLAQLLQDSQIRAALDPEGTHRDMGASANRLRAALYTRRFPDLDFARTTANRLVRNLALPRTIRMTLPENFESMEYNLAFSFTSPQDYADAVKALSQLSSHPSFQTLLER